MAGGGTTHECPDPGLGGDPGHHLLTRQDEPQTSVERVQTLLSLISL